MNVEHGTLIHKDNKWYVEVSYNVGFARGYETMSYPVVKEQQNFDLFSKDETHKVRVLLVEDWENFNPTDFKPSIEAKILTEEEVAKYETSTKESTQFHRWLEDHLGYKIERYKISPVYSAEKIVGYNISVVPTRELEYINIDLIITPVGNQT